MKIFIYSDLHISRTSSIMPTSNDSLYTYRQNMIVTTGELLSNIIRQEKPDMIVNCGDTFDQSTLTSYDIDTASKFFKCFDGINIPHYVLVGNHDMVNNYFNAVSLLQNIPNIEVVTEPKTLEFNDIRLAFLPYCSYKDIDRLPEGNILFSHQDIQGSIIRGDFALPNGLAQEQLQQYSIVFNGHIHKSSNMRNIINVGSITTQSFSDDNDTIPQCYVYDTVTGDLKTFRSNICPLFRKINITTTLDELKSKLDILDPNYRYIINCECPFSIKEEVKEYLKQNVKILNFRILARVDKTEQEDTTLEDDVEIDTNINIFESFKQFLETVDLKVPKKYYIDIVENISC